MDIKNLLEQRSLNFKKLQENEKDIVNAKNIILKALKKNNKILFFGNGGSASDSNHLACEFISKFMKKRTSMPAISLSSNNSIISAIGNDFSFDEVFKRQIEGLGNKNDVAIGISTSGKSKNVLKGLDFAKEKGLKTILFTGNNKKNYEYDCTLKVPSHITAQIQEMHIAVGHIICGLIEEELF